MARASPLLAAAFLAAWLLPPFWAMATLRTVNVQDDIYTSDLLNDRLPARAFVGRSVRSGELPLWAPEIYTGFPVLAAVESGSLYPPNVLLFGLLDPYAALAWEQLLSLWIAGLGALRLARELGQPPLACALAGGAFALSGFFVGHLRQLNMVDAAAWTPWLFVFVERGLAGDPRAPLRFCWAWTLQLLAGHPQVSYVTALGLVAFFFGRLAHHKSSPDPARPALGRGQGLATAARLFAAGVLATGLAGAQLVPSIELAWESHRRFGFDLKQAMAFPASPWSSLQFLLPFANGDPGRDDFRLSGLFWEQHGYLGLVPFVLALTTLADLRRDRTVRLLWGIAGVSWLLVLGPHTPLFPLAFRLLPGLRYFRFPTRFLLLVELSLALLAAIGLGRLVRRVGQRTALMLPWAALALTAVDLWTNQTRLVPQVPLDVWRKSFGTLAALREASRSHPEPWRYFSLDSSFVHAAVFHSAGGWAGNLAEFVRLRALLQPSSNLLYGLETPDGYANLAPRYYEAVWGSDKEPGLVRPSGEPGPGSWRLHPWVGRLLRMFNVRYVIGAYPAESPVLGLPRVFQEGFGIQEVSDPIPRAFVVGKARAVADDSAALEHLRSEGFDPASEAIVHSPDFQLPEGARPSREVRVERRGSRRLEVAVRLAAPGLLVVSEGYYPGWKAFVDGREVPILRANMMMRAVVLPPGEHRVEFRFEPWSVRLGLAVSALAGAAIAFFRRRLSAPAAGH
jgi:hypothetical protein